LVGAVGVVRNDLDPTGTVFVQGELWSAEAADGAIDAGQLVRVVHVSGLRLRVRKAAAVRA
jgi:membrane-bound serine protease (ClpP class)